MPAPMIDRIRGLIIDMDGVLWRDSHPIGNLPGIFKKIEDLGLKMILASNNATASIEMIQNKLAGFGVNLAAGQIINSSLVAGRYLAKKYPRGGDIYVIGEAGLISTLKSYGFQHTPGENPLAVIVGMDREISFEKLSRATELIRKGALFIGTNPDATYPTPAGLVPGAGSIIAAVATAAGTRPILMGKPEPEIFHACLERMDLAPGDVLVIGDRLETDIAGGQRLEMPVALVLSGVTTLDEAQKWQPDVSWIGPDLATLIFDTLAR